jgi:tripartite-type tricarboxylate transporter receptor subunit TctC
MNLTRRDMVARAAAACAAATLLPWQVANAQQAWPAKPIKLVNMGPPGSPPDTYGRIYADRLSKVLGVPVIVENRPGAGANLASDAVAKAPADGYTLLYTVSNAFVINPWIYSKLSFNPEKDLRPVSPILSQGAFIVVNNDLPVKSVKELVAYAKERPGKLAYASYGIGGFPHLAMELFCERAQVQMLHVPYKTGPLTDVVSGQVQLMVEPAASAIPMIRSGRVRAIAATSAKRHPQLPDVPTVAETYTEFALTGWHGIWAPAGVPNDIVQRLNSEITRISQSPEIRKQIMEMGSEPMTATTENMAAMVRSEAKLWGDLLKTKNITVD